MTSMKTVSIAPPHFPWPTITEPMRAAVLKQLDDSISIYDRSGIFARFEEKFAAYHSARHALLTSSGTMALYSVFDALGLQPRDEVLCPDYTFFATVSPLVALGVTPVFCDAGPDGNIDPATLWQRVSPKTRAVVVTHMWGVPCDMDAIGEFCAAHELPLVEDCSHAHGATYRGKPVGSFGTAAVWSLQGQKLVTGGEGGVIVTNDTDLYYRALLVGHYNKRCKQEINPASPLSKYAQTGFGLKLRAHPLAIAIAEVLFDELDAVLAVKRQFASRLTERLERFDWLELPVAADRAPSWYAYAFRVSGDADGTCARQLHDLSCERGAVEIDLPSSTGSVSELPLFRDLQNVRPQFYTESPMETACPRSRAYTRNTLKLPVPWHPDQAELWARYVDAIEDACESLEAAGSVEVRVMA
jgi:dTDP-4-amino-4,6-dideoxygalactose transaminase